MVHELESAIETEYKMHVTIHVDMIEEYWDLILIHIVESVNAVHTIYLWKNLSIF